MQSDNNVIEESYPLANLDFENDSVSFLVLFFFLYLLSDLALCPLKITDVALGHSDSEELSDDVTETTSMSTGSVQKTIAGSGQAEVGVGVGIKVSCN